MRAPLLFATAAATAAAVLLAAPASSFATPACTCGDYTVIDRAQKTGFGCFPGHFRYLMSATLYCCDGRKLFESNSGYELGPCDGGPVDLGLVPYSACNYEAPTCGETPDVCDGHDNDQDGQVDEGCPSGKCPEENQDDHPVRFSSGSVETKPIVPFSLPTPADVFFGVALRWGSELGHDPNYALFNNRSATDFFGRGTIDAYGDRLLLTQPHTLPLPETPAHVKWQSWDTQRDFSLIGTSGGVARYQTTDALFELRDHGVGAVPRYRVVRRSDGKIWEFGLIDYQEPGQVRHGRFAVLTRMAVPADAATFAGGYGLNFTRDAAGRLIFALDSFGRRLDYVQENVGFTHVVDVTYQAPGGAPAITVAHMVYGVDGTRLSAVENGADASRGHTRFSYFADPVIGTATCSDCRNLVAEVMRATTSTVLPAEDAPAQADEQVIEGHIWRGTNNRAIAIGSYGPSRRWGYRYDSSPTCLTTGACRTVQMDLLHPDGNSCDPAHGVSCAAGFECWSADATASTAACYPATYIDYDSAAQQVTSKSGHIILGAGQRGYDALGRVAWLLDDDGVRTTYSYDGDGRVACMVMDDDNENAGQPPACDAPPGKFFQAISRSGNVETRRRAGSLPGSPGVTTVSLLDAAGRAQASTTTGATRTIDGALVMRTSSESTQYDDYGRPQLYIGPADGGGVLDRVSFSYQTSGAGAGLVYQKTRLVGATAAPVQRVTTYEDYDIYGVAHRVTDADGVVTTLVLSNNRLIWSSTTSAPGTPDAITIMSYNPDGSLRTQVDAEGVCTTYERRADQDLVKRSASNDPACGHLPIDEHVGEVRIARRDEPGHVQVSAEQRWQDGAKIYERGFQHDSLGRQTAMLVEGRPMVSRIYEGARVHEILEGACPGPECTDTVHDYDALGRRQSISRMLADGSAATTDFAYEQAFRFMPGHLARGRAHGESVASSFVYDDFDHVVEWRTAEAGVTRQEYDAAGHLRLERVGVGTSAQRTRSLDYDARGRLARIDEDLEHPVDCASAPSGTAIADSEYRHDDCDPADTPAGFTCTSGQGRLTVARALLGCVDGQVWSRATWFAYDARGRVVKQAIAERRGTTLAPAYVASYEWTAGGQPRFVGNPLAPAYGTAFQYDTTGRLVTVAESASSSFTSAQVIASLGSYAPFGPARLLSLVGGIKRSKILSSDYQPLGIAWAAASPWQSLFELSYAYDQAGKLRSRVDAVASGLAGGTRYLQRDALGRIACESAQVITPGCTNGLLRATYSDGESASLPPDQRRVVKTALPGYAPADTYVFEPGTTRLARIDRGPNAPATVYTSDPLGRRTREEEPSLPGSLRSYTYLPSGRLGGISGVDVDGHPYQLQLHHDADGRVVLVVDAISGDVEEYFYDLRGHLVAARRRGGGSASGEAQLVGASKEPGSPTLTSWYSDGTYAVGSLAILDTVQARRPFRLPAGEQASDIVGTALGPNGVVATFYRDGKSSLGHAADLGDVESGFSYLVPAGHVAADIVAVAYNAQGDHRFYTWYRDGLYSVGSARNLGQFVTSAPFSPVWAGQAMLAVWFSSASTCTTLLVGGQAASGSPSMLVQGPPMRWGGVPPGPSSPQRWSFHEIAGAPALVTREIDVGNSTRIKRLYLLSDENGVPLRLVDGAGTTQVAGYITAGGWRTVTQRADFAWLPQALPGQIVLERTAARVGANLLKPAIALNGAREYDPLVGGFIEPDPADGVPREDPEGYVYGRNDPQRNLDPSGMFSVNSNCGGAEGTAKIMAAVAKATADLLACKDKECSDDQKHLLIAMMNYADYTCDAPQNLGGYVDEDPTRDGIHLLRTIVDTPEPDGGDCRPTMGPLPTTSCCLRQEVTHEAIHQLDGHWDGAYDDLPFGHDRYADGPAKMGRLMDCVHCANGF